MKPSARTLGFFAVTALFLSPYFVALFVSKFSLRVPDGFPQLVMTSTLQAAASAFLSVALGVVGAWGLVKRSPRWEAIAIAPSVAPAIAMVLGFMSVFPNWRGWSTVVVAHALGASGLVAVILCREIRSTIGASLELAWVEGASMKAVWWRGILPALRQDILRLGLSVFAASLASFSIPLLLGGSKAVTVEIAIHHAIRFENAWDVAAALSIFQWLMLSILVLLLRKREEGDERRAESVRRSEVSRWLGSDLAVVSILIAPALLTFALLRGPFLGWSQLEGAGLFQDLAPLIKATQGSFVSATLAALISAMLLLVYAAIFPSRRWRLWMSGYVAPSVAIMGFATLLIGWGQSPSFGFDSVRIAVGTALMFTPILWRLRWEQALTRIESQVLVAQTLGASHGMIVRRVIFPQVRVLTFWSAGLISFWVWSDYAIGSIAASRTMTMALLAKSLLENYRLEAASILIVVCLLLGAISYPIITAGGSSRVSR